MYVYFFLNIVPVLVLSVIVSLSLWTPLQASEEAWANRLQSDERVKETQTAVRNVIFFPYIIYMVLLTLLDN